MRDHIRREAANSLDTTWWLVPIAFAVASLAVIAFTGVAIPDEATVAPVPVLPAMSDAAGPGLPAVSPRRDDSIEVSQHVQAF